MALVYSTQYRPLPCKVLRRYGRRNVQSAGIFRRIPRHKFGKCDSLDDYEAGRASTVSSYLRRPEGKVNIHTQKGKSKVYTHYFYDQYKHPNPPCCTDDMIDLQRRRE